MHVARDVEAWIVDPLLALDAAAEARQRIQAGVDVAPQRGDGGGRSLELQGPADVQGRLGGLEVKKRCVESAEAIGRRHAARSLPESESLKDPGRVSKKPTRAPLRGRPRWSSDLGSRDLLVAPTHIGLLPFRRGPGDGSVSRIPLCRAVWALPGSCGASRCAY